MGAGQGPRCSQWDLIMDLIEFVIVTAFIMYMTALAFRMMRYLDALRVETPRPAYYAMAYARASDD